MDIDTAEQSILRTLSGLTPNPGSAAGPDGLDLAAAAAVYQAAGRAALTRALNTDWRQVYIRFTDPNTAEQAATTHLLPILQDAQQRGTLASWWFIRKPPGWRMRILPAGPAEPGAPDVQTALDGLVAAGYLDAWWPGIYEAETAAFGGGPAMDIAHQLFAADSQGVLELARTGGGLGRRELSVLLCSAMMRAAGLEWYERGDVWARVAAERRLPADIPTDKLAAMGTSLRTLMIADTSGDGAHFGPHGPASAQRLWAQAFADAGKSLAEHQAHGDLQRGLREILAYHVIFHWNRLGLPTRTQAVLAHAASHLILGSSEPAFPATLTIPATPRRAVDPDLAVARFPLILQGQGGPFCTDLDTRIAQVANAAAQSAGQADLEKRVNDSCHAWNLAALIATDCDMPDLAEQLCLQQFQIFQDTWPVSGRIAIASLQPLVNLARLAERTGQPQLAFDTLMAISHALDTAGATTVAGITISFENLIAPDGDDSFVRPWLRRVLREDGTRALIAAGLWDKAAQHAEDHDDHPEQLREARQTRIIAEARLGQPEHARSLLAAINTTAAWDRAIAACLQVYIDAKSGAADANTAASMITAVQAIRTTSDPVTDVARIRLGLAATRLATDLLPEQARRLFNELAHDAEQSPTTYAAREILDDPLSSSHLHGETATLAGIVAAAGIRSGSIPTHLHTRLTESVQAAGTVLAQALRIAGAA